MTDKEIRQILADDWYEFFMEHSPSFRNLSMDMQGEMVMDAVNHQLEYHGPNQFRQVTPTEPIAEIPMFTMDTFYKGK